MTDKPYIPYSSEQPWLPFSEALIEWDESFHHLMLNDHIRMKQYEKAIKETVKPGDIVVDLGTGTGILSRWALEAGASTVYGIDMDNDILSRATETMAALGFAKQFKPLNQSSYQVSLPEKADVLISEIMGNILDNEDFQPILADAIKRLLKPGGRKIPRQASSYIVPINSKKAYHAVCNNQVATINGNYNLSRMLANKGIIAPHNIYYDTIIPRSTYLADVQQLQEYSGNWDQSSIYQKDLLFEVTTDGFFNGFKAYFIAQLSRNCLLDISGDGIEKRQTSDSWKHAYLPIRSPITVEKGDVIKLSFARFYQRDHDLESEKLNQAYKWQGKVIRDGSLIAAFSQSMGDTRIKTARLSGVGQSLCHLSS